ncbi:uncharacterized protein LOC119175572 [Rhipicephalus microplus]|uniref:uncharacterized protein LOC119175572 n=1 Tax=Rhipicephalus microplus TaxID=6941 RepID=UPI003F6CF2F9
MRRKARLRRLYKQLRPFVETQVTRLLQKPFSPSQAMNSLLIALFVCVFAGICTAGFIEYGGGFGGYGGYGGGLEYGGGFGHGLGHVKTVAGPSFLVKTVHNVNRVSHGSTLYGRYGHGGGYGGYSSYGGVGGGYGGSLGGGYSSGYGGGYGGGYAKVAVKG